MEKILIVILEACNFKSCDVHNNEIRSIWNSEEEEYYYSVVDVIAALTNSDYQKIKKLLEMVKR